MKINADLLKIFRIFIEKKILIKRLYIEFSTQHIAHKKLAYTVGKLLKLSLRKCFKNKYFYASINKFYLEAI